MIFLFISLCISFYNLPVQDNVEEKLLTGMAGGEVFIIRQLDLAK